MFQETKERRILKTSAAALAPLVICLAQASCTTPQVVTEPSHGLYSSSETHGQLKKPLELIPTSTPAPEPKPITYGKLFGENATNIPKADRFRVLTPTGRNKFLARIGDSKVEVPAQSLILEGPLSWSDKVTRLPWLGFDCAQPQLVGKIAEMGANRIRIPVEQSDEAFFRRSQDVLQAIQNAKKENLNITLLINPTKLLPKPETEKRIDNLLNIVGNYPHVSFELGNEPDLQQFWEGSNLKTFAKFVKDFSEIISKKRPKAELIVGAASQEQSIRPLLQALKGENLDLNKFSIALHSYNSAQDVKKRINIVKQELGGNPKIVFTELGWNKTQDDKGFKVVEMVEEARKNGVKDVYIFQLRNIAFPADVGPGFWGFIDHFAKWEVSASALIDYIWGKLR